eukprot:3512760-Amphidinium_carterae.1
MRQIGYRSSYPLANNVRIITKTPSTASNPWQSSMRFIPISALCCQARPMLGQAVRSSEFAAFNPASRRANDANPHPCKLAPEHQLTCYLVHVGNDALLKECPYQCQTSHLPCTLGTTVI